MLQITNHKSQIPPPSPHKCGGNVLPPKCGGNVPPTSTEVIASFLATGTTGGGGQYAVSSSLSFSVIYILNCSNWKVRVTFARTGKFELHLLELESSSYNCSNWKVRVTFARTGKLELHLLELESSSYICSNWKVRVTLFQSLRLV